MRAMFSSNPSPSAPASTPIVAASHGFTNQAQPPYSSPPTYEEALGGVRVSGVDYTPAPPAGISVAALPNPSLMTSMPPQQWSPPYPASTGFPQPQRFPREHSVSVYPGMQNTCRGDRPCNCCQHNPPPNSAMPRQQYPQAVPVRQYPIVVPIQTPDSATHRPPACVRCFITIFVIIFFVVFFTIVFKIIRH